MTHRECLEECIDFRLRVEFPNTRRFLPGTHNFLTYEFNKLPLIVFVLYRDVHMHTFTPHGLSISLI